jgi:peroxin-19
MSKPGDSSTAYRNTTVVDDDEDDLDDLDGECRERVSPCPFGNRIRLGLTLHPDVLASFNAPPAKSSAEPLADASPGPKSQPPVPPPTAAALDNDDDEFEASLVEGMESLLRQLAGEHPPGPMPDTTEDVTGVAAGATSGEEKKLSPEEEEAAWQRAVEMMLSGEGLSAMGLEGKSPGSSAPSDAAKGKSKSPGSQSSQPQEQPSFEETIRRTMESLKTAGEGSRNTNGGGGGSGKNGAPDISELLRQLSADPSMLDGLGDGDDDELGGLLDGMMNQLMTREVLEEPMSELASKVSQTRLVEHPCRPLPFPSSSDSC